MDDSCQSCSENWGSCSMACGFPRICCPNWCWFGKWMRFLFKVCCWRPLPRPSRFGISLAVLDFTTQNHKVESMCAHCGSNERFQPLSSFLRAHFSTASVVKNHLRLLLTSPPTPLICCAMRFFCTLGSVSSNFVFIAHKNGCRNTGFVS